MRLDRRHAADQGLSVSRCWCTARRRRSASRLLRGPDQLGPRRSDLLELGVPEGGPWMIAVRPRGDPSLSASRTRPDFGSLLTPSAMAGLDLVEDGLVRVQEPRQSTPSARLAGASSSRSGSGRYPVRVARRCQPSMPGASFPMKFSSSRALASFVVIILSQSPSGIAPLKSSSLTWAAVLNSSKMLSLPLGFQSTPSETSMPR